MKTLILLTVFMYCNVTQPKPSTVKSLSIRLHKEYKIKKVITKDIALYLLHIDTTETQIIKSHKQEIDYIINDNQ